MPLSDASRKDSVRAWLSRGDNLSEWNRLREALELADEFTFLAVAAEDVAAERMLAELVTEEAASRGVVVRGFELGSASADRHVVSHVLAEIAQSPSERWFYFCGGPEAATHTAELGRAWLLLNQKRDVISMEAAAPFVLALHPQDWLAFRRNAPDFWSIYQASFRFGPARVPAEASANSTTVETASHARLASTGPSSSSSGWKLEPTRAEFSADNFVGRGSEQRFLLASLREAGARILVVGSGGIGKSTLVRHVVAQLFDHYPDGIWWVPLYELSGSTQERSVAALGRLIGDLLPRTTPPTALDERAGLFRSATDGRQMLFVFDDLDDDKQLESLTPGGSASVVAISRQAPSSVGQHFNVLQLAPLSREETRQFLRRIAPAMSESVASSVLASSDGSPLIAKLIGAYLNEFPDQGVEAATLADKRHGAELVRGLIDRSLLRVTPDAASLWPVLGILKPVFTVNDVVAVSEIDASKVSAALDSLSTLGLVTPISDDQFSFAHVLLKEASLAQLGTSDTTVRYLVRALEQGRFGEFSADSVASVLARYGHGNPMQRSLRNSVLRGLEWALRSPDWSQAAQFSMALAEAAGNYGDAETERVAIRQLPSLLAGLGQFDRMAAAARRWIELAGRDATDELAGAYRSAAAAARLNGQPQEAVEYAQIARKHANALGSSRDEVLALFELSLARGSLGEFDLALQDVREATRLAEMSGSNRQLLSQALSLSGDITSSSGHAEQAIELYNKALEISSATDDDSAVQTILLRLGGEQERMEALDAAREVYSRAADLGKKIGDQRAWADAMQALGRVELKRGNLRASVQYFDSAIKAYDQVGLSPDASEALLQRAIAAARLGDIAGALDTMEKLEPRLMLDPTSRTSDAAIAFLKALIGTLHGNVDLAQQRFHAHLLMGAALLWRGDRERVEEHVAEMRKEFAQDFGEEVAEEAAGLLRDRIEKLSTA